MGRRRVLAGLVLWALVLTLVPARAGPGSLIAGACVMDLEVTLASGWGDITTPSPGECETSDGPADGWLDGDFGPFPNYGCVGGVGDGHADLNLDLGGGLTPGWSGTSLEVTNTAGVIEVVFFDLGNPHIAASGHFVQDPADTLSCLAGGDTVTWSGVLVFEDPEIP